MQRREAVTIFIIRLILGVATAVGIGLSIALPLLDWVNEPFDEYIKHLQKAQEILRDLIASMKGGKDA